MKKVNSFNRFVNEAKRAKKKRLDPKERRRMIQSGEAMKDGSFPISTAQDIINAIKLVGLANDVEAAQDHIIKRASDLLRDDLIPKFWIKKREEGPDKADKADS